MWRAAGRALALARAAGRSQRLGISSCAPWAALSSWVPWVPSRGESPGGAALSLALAGGFPRSRVGARGMASKGKKGAGAGAQTAGGGKAGEEATKEDDAEAKVKVSELEVGDVEEWAAEHMTAAVKATLERIGKMSGGNATPHVLENLMVKAYGGTMPMRGVAQITADKEGTKLTVQCYDPSTSGAVQQAIDGSNMGLFATADPESPGALFVPIPQLDPVRRQAAAKAAKEASEIGKNHVRHLRQQAITHIKQLEKEKSASKDEAFSASQKIEALTAKHVSAIGTEAERAMAKVLSK